MTNFDVDTMITLARKGLSQADIQAIADAQKRNAQIIEADEDANYEALSAFRRIAIVRRRPSYRKPQARPVNSPGIPKVLRRAS